MKTYAEIKKLNAEAFERFGYGWKRYSIGEYTVEIANDAVVSDGASIGNRASIERWN